MIDKEPYKSCDECQLMRGTDLFTEDEIVSYHDGERDMYSFDKRRQNVILGIFASLDDEIEDYA